MHTAVVADLTREYMDNLWTKKDFLGQDDRELFFWHHRLNHGNFKYLLILYKRIIIPKKISKVRKLPPCVDRIFG